MRSQSNWINQLDPPVNEIIHRLHFPVSETQAVIRLAGLEGVRYISFGAFELRVTKAQYQFATTVVI